MSYDIVTEYEMIPTDTFKIIRGCACCGSKKLFSCKDRFRVNANGNRLDIWLIYGCEKCGHTYNLSVYERIRPDKIPRKEYEKFLANDKDKVYEIGTSKTIFDRNRAEIAWDACGYKIVPLAEKEADFSKDRLLMKIHNPYGIPVRTDKVAAEILGLTRSRVKKLLNDGVIDIHNDIQKAENNL